MSRASTSCFWLDVGKEEHHACRLNPDGQGVYDQLLPQAEGNIRTLLVSLSADGPVGRRGHRDKQPHLICIVRRRIYDLHAMLQHGAPSRPTTRCDLTNP